MSYRLFATYPDLRKRSEQQPKQMPEKQSPVIVRAQGYRVNNNWFASIEDAKIESLSSLMTDTDPKSLARILIRNSETVIEILQMSDKTIPAPKRAYRKRKLKSEIPMPVGEKAGDR